jgi:hypothetical protein
MNEFDEAVRQHISAILKQRYHTIRRGGHPSDKDEFLHDRRFWPDMQFLGVATYRTAEGNSGLTVTFTPVSESGNVYGFKIDMTKSLATWGKRIGIVNPREHPVMFAAELIWYMVAYIGAIDITSSLADGFGIRWINNGSEIFTKLPEAAATKPTSPTV